MAPEGFDFEKARAALRKKLDEMTGHHQQHQARLDNPEFLAKAAPECRSRCSSARGTGGPAGAARKQLRLLAAN